jgi:hypothetical protein
VRTIWRERPGIKVSAEFVVSIKAARIFGSRNLRALWLDPGNPIAPDAKTDPGKALRHARAILDIPADWPYSDRGLRHFVRVALRLRDLKLREWSRREIWDATHCLIEHRYKRGTGLLPLSEAARLRTLSIYDVMAALWRQ